jgi:hypothetical protein
MAEPQELLAFLLEQYQKQDLGEPGEEARDAALDQLDQKLNTHEERMAAREGIKHFLEFGRQFLLEHPPQTYVMLAQGFGVQLAGGYEVALVPATIEDLGGTMEDSPSFHVTEGRSIRGQGGVTSTEAVGVTGNQPEPSLRNPGG